MHTQTITRADVIAAIEALPADKLAEVYDFARFIAERSTVVAAVPDFLKATPEELAAEDAAWDAALSVDSDKLKRMADGALKAHREGLTTDIDDAGDELQPAHEVESRS